MEEKKKKLQRKSHRWLWALLPVVLPVFLFLLLSIAVYLPPVQRYAVGKATEWLSESMGIDARIEKVRLSFPLDLALLGVEAHEASDTLAVIRSLRLEVRMLPLLRGQVEVDGLGIYDARLDTRAWIPDFSLRGRIGELSASLHGIDLRHEKVVLNEALLRRADLWVALGDTASQDTTPSTAKWQILAEKVDLDEASVRLSMPGDSMRIALRADKAALRNGNFDTGRGDYKVEHFLLQGALAYLTRPAWNDGRQGNDAFRRNDSLCWPDKVPAMGIDPSFLELDTLELQLDSLSYFGNGNLEAALRHLSFSERSGFHLDELSGGVEMTPLRLRLNHWKLRTPASRMDWEAALDWNALREGKGGEARWRVDGAVGSHDIRLLANGIVDDGFLKALPDASLALRSIGEGNVDLLRLDSLLVKWPGVLELEADGQVKKPTTAQREGQLRFDLRTGRSGFMQSALMDSTATAYALPGGWTLAGRAQVKGDRYSMRAQSTLDKGRLLVDGSVDLASEAYQLKFESHKFPIQRFLLNMGLGALTARLQAKGRGFDPLKKTARLEAEAVLDTLRMNRWELGHLGLQAVLKDSNGELTFASDNDLLLGSGTIAITLGDRIEMKLRSELPGVNVTNLTGMKDTLQVGANFDLDAYTDRHFKEYGFGGGIRNVRFITKDKGIMARDVLFKFDTADDTTRLWTSAGDLEMRLSARVGIEQMLQQVAAFGKTMQEQLVGHSLNQQELKKIMPVLDFHLQAGKNNPLGNILRNLGYNYEQMHLDLSAAPEKGMGGRFRMKAFSTGGLMLDTVYFDLHQDSTGLVANGKVHNYERRNPNKFEASLRSYLLDKGAGIELRLQDQKGKESILLGVRANVADSGVSVNIYPEHPVIAYRRFTVNKDNYVFFSNRSTVSANVDLLADDGTGLRVMGLPSDSLTDLQISLNRVNLRELSDVLPYLPKLGGMLDGDLRIVENPSNYSAFAGIRTEKLEYEGVPLGNMSMDAKYLPGEAGLHHLEASVGAEGKEVVQLKGTYDTDHGGRFDGAAHLLDFPLALVNGFLSGTDMAMSGTVAGMLNVVSGEESPLLNGELQFKEAHLYSDVYGVDFRMSDDKVYLKDGRLQLKDYALHSKQSNNPLLLNGWMDMRDLANIRMNFNMQARNFELINARKKPKSMVFGKVYANFDGSVRGSLENMYVRGKLEVLDRTDMTYILRDSPLTVDDRLHDLVQFVSFADSVFVEEKPAPTGSFDMTLGIVVSDAAVFHCNLSEDGSNYVDLEGGGDLTLRLTQQGDMRLTGRFTATSGEMKYSLPIIPLKTFKLLPGSYVEFTGDVANPTLNIAATERMRSTVTENEQPRSVAFDVGVKITQPLDKMGLEFTIEAPEDLSIQNQLAAMTKAERGKAAVAMLATGMYLTDETLSGSGSGSGFKASNALTAFLQSEIQNIAGSALKTIDVSIGMENNTTATGATTTDYSFQFAKRFWGNRISVIVGGKVSTGAEAENSAESFINNIKVEYRLDKTASRYVQVFYDRSVQDPLEGQLTKAGAGLILRRKSDRLGELFIFRPRKKKVREESQTVTKKEHEENEQ